jgi:hypothetical protein
MQVVYPGREGAMPIFHLHIRTGDVLIRDVEGVTLPDLAAAHAEAVRGARSMMGAEVLGGHLHLDQSIELHDGNGRHLATVPFRDVLRIED